MTLEPRDEWDLERVDPDGTTVAVCLRCGEGRRFTEASWAKRPRAECRCAPTIHTPYGSDIMAQMLTSMGGATLDEIGAVFGYTRERVRQFEVAAREKFQRRLEMLMRREGVEALMPEGRMERVYPESPPHYTYGQRKKKTG